MMFFFWSIDEAMPILLCLGIGIVVKKTMLALFIGYIVVRIYRRLKESNPDRFFLHMAYHFGILPVATRTLVNPFEERIIQ